MPPAPKGPLPSGTPLSRVWAVLAVALVAVSFSSIIIRWADAPGVVVAFYRMLIASVVVAPLTVRGFGRSRPTAAALRSTVMAGALLALHFAAWISSLSFTTVAASVSLAATTPLWVVLFSWLFQGRPPAFMQLLAVLLAVAGAAVIGYGDVTGGSSPLLGDALALIGSAAAGGYLLLGRRAQQQGMSLNAYVGSAYAVAALVLAPLPLLFGLPYGGYPAATYLLVALLALVPQLVGHTGINFASKHLDPTLVASALLLEPVASGLLALMLFGEEPSVLTLVGAVILLAGVGAAVRSPARNHA